MAVRRAAAGATKAPAKKETAKSAAGGNVANPYTSTGTAGTDPVWVRHQALSFARALWPNEVRQGDKISPSQLITAASKLESYMLNGRPASSKDDA